MFFVFQIFLIYPANSKQLRPSQTRIRSDIIDIKQKSQKIDFIKNVVIEKDDSSMLADKMTIFYDSKEDKNTSSKKNSIKKIEANTNVKIFSQDFVASGDSGYYDPKNNKFILQENVLVNNGTSIASGKEFVYDIKTKKGQFIGDKDLIKNKEKSLKDGRIMVIINEDINELNKSSK